MDTFGILGGFQLRPLWLLGEGERGGGGGDGTFGGG